MHDRGIDDFFGNEETAFGPIVELFTKSASQGSVTHKPITVPHEYVAASMADGFYRATGYLLVMVRVFVRSADGVGVNLKAAHAHILILWSAGRAKGRVY